MAARLLPLNIAELCAHALELERDAAQRFRDYATRMDELGEKGIAGVFEELAAEENQEIRALEVVSGTRKPSELSPWEYAWRLTYMPEALDKTPRLVPRNAHEALQLALLAKRRAEAFLNDVAENARDEVVRGCAAEMAVNERRLAQLLERLLTGEIPAERAGAKSGSRDARTTG